MIDLIGKIGGFGSLAIIAAAALWSLAEMLLFARLSRMVTMDFGRVEFADDGRDTLLAEVIVTNASRTRATLKGIWYKYVDPDDWSRLDMDLALLSTESNQIAAFHPETWHPGQRYTMVIAVPWNSRRRAALVSFNVALVQSIDIRGIIYAFARFVTFRPWDRTLEVGDHRLLTAAMAECRKGDHDHESKQTAAIGRA